MSRDASGPRRRGPRRCCPGVWRLRLPLPWPGVPHGNVWAVAADGGIVLFDTGIGGKGRLRQLRPRPRPGRLRRSRTSACSSAPTPTPTTTASPRRSSRAPAASSGCTRPGSTSGCSPTTPPRRSSSGSRSPARAASRRRRWSATASRAAATTRPGSTRSSSPTATSLPGVEVETDLGTWQVHETPGHAPSHVVLHQPERRLMISGDHLLGRTVLFFDHGHSPDPVGEFLAQPRRGRAARGRPLPARPRPPLPRPRGEDRRGAAPGRRAARQGARGARPRARGPPSRSSPRSSAPRTSTRRPAPGCCRSSSPASTTWRSSARSRAVEGTDPAALELLAGSLSRRWPASPSCARSRRRRRSSSTCSPTTARYAEHHAAAEVRAGAGGRAGAQRGRGDPGPAPRSGRRCARK